MTDPAAAVFPGPDALGRWVIVGPGGRAPDGYPDAPHVRIDDEVLAHPGPVVAFLHARWARRQRTVVELAVPNEVLQEPQVDARDPWDLPRGFTFERERLAFLAWANSYDARTGAPTWWDAELAVRGGADHAPDGTPGEVVVDGRPAWCDGGPRGPVPVAGVATTEVDGAGLLHRETIRARRRDPTRVPLRLLGSAAPSDDLAPDQLAAVAHASGAARVIAPAGSGKTRVLTARVRHLLRDRGIEPGLVTAVAYNTRAAAEMRGRLPSLPANVRTLHSLGLRICNLVERRELIHERDQRTILDRLVRTAKIPNQDPFQPYLDALTTVRLGLRRPEAVGPEFELDDFAEVFARYREELDRRGAMDFDEQIFHAIELLLTDAALRAHVQQQCTHLLVDEFQDLTPAFHLLVRLVASPSLEVFAVGDDDQVIYGYAGADPGYLIDFARDFPGAAAHPLEVNYRCPGPVVEQVGRLLSHNERRVAKVIRAVTPTPTSTDPTPTSSVPSTTNKAADGTLDVRGGAGVELHPTEAGAMAGRTVALVRDHLEAGARPSDVAVLTRVNATLLPVQLALGEAGIPCDAPLDPTVVGRTGIRTALAYLRLGLDPDRMRREDVFDTLNRPSRKVKSAVSELLRGQRFSRGQLDQVTDALSVTHAERWQGYLDDLQYLTDAITAGADTARCLWIIRNRIGLGEAMDTLDSARSRPEGSSHGDDLDALDQLATLQPDPVSFREWLVEALRREVATEDRVTLSTVHRVKGMEWDHVVVFAANRGLMPHRLSDQHEEERRVFHVAVTRARRSVAVVHDRSSASPFVDELRHDPPDRATTPDATGPRRPAAAATAPSTGAPLLDGDVRAEPGVQVTAPGSIDVTVRLVDRTPTGPELVVDVDGVDARLALDAPVHVDGQPVRLRVPATAARVPSTSPARVGRLLPDTGDDDLDPASAARFEALRDWRTEQARRQQVPPYIVFNDAHLRGIARADPDSLVQLSRCAGVGPTKLDQYGDAVLEVLAATSA